MQLILEIWQAQFCHHQDVLLMVLASLQVWQNIIVLGYLDTNSVEINAVKIITPNMQNIISAFLIIATHSLSGFT